MGAPKDCYRRASCIICDWTHMETYNTLTRLTYFLFATENITSFRCKTNMYQSWGYSFLFFQKRCFDILSFLQPGQTYAFRYEALSDTNQSESFDVKVFVSPPSAEPKSFTSQSICVQAGALMRFWVNVDLWNFIKHDNDQARLRCKHFRHGQRLPPFCCPSKTPLAALRVTACICFLRFERQTRAIEEITCHIC